MREGWVTYCHILRLVNYHWVGEGSRGNITVTSGQAQYQMYIKQSQREGFPWATRNTPRYSLQLWRAPILPRYTDSIPYLDPPGLNSGNYDAAACTCWNGLPNAGLTPLTAGLQRATTGTPRGYLRVDPLEVIREHFFFFSFVFSFLFRVPFTQSSPDQIESIQLWFSWCLPATT